VPAGVHGPDAGEDSKRQGGSKLPRSDKFESRFIVPETGGYAAQFTLYLFKVNSQLKKYQGRVWFTGPQSDMLKNQPMGRHTFAKLPHDIASLLSLPNPFSVYIPQFQKNFCYQQRCRWWKQHSRVDRFFWVEEPQHVPGVYLI
jgi:hypothetical protein